MMPTVIYGRKQASFLGWGDNGLIDDSIATDVNSDISGQEYWYTYDSHNRVLRADYLKNENGDLVRGEKSF